MRIGILVWKLDITGGTEKQGLELAKYLQKNGHWVEIYTAYLNKEKCHPELISQIQSIKCLENKEKRGDNFFYKALLHLDVFRKSKKLANLISSDLDVLNCHEYPTFLVGAFYKKRTSIPAVGTVNDVPSFQGVYEFSQSPSKFLISFLKRKFYHPFLKSMNALAVLDNINVNRLKKYHGLEAQIIRSGCDIEKIPYIKRVGQNPRLKLLAIGTFCPWRRYEDLIEAFKILRDEKIDFEFNHLGSEAVDRRYAKKIKRMVKKFDLSDSVFFHGRADEKKFLYFLSNSDVFLFPNYPQTWGLVVFEALSAGLPAVIASSCGAAEVLEDGKNAFFVPSKSPKKIAEAIIKLKEDQNLWRKLSENGRKFVEENIRWDLYGQNMLNLFQKTLNRNYEP